MEGSGPGVRHVSLRVSLVTAEPRDGDIAGNASGGADTESKRSVITEDYHIRGGQNEIDSETPANEMTLSQKMERAASWMEI